MERTYGFWYLFTCPEDECMVFARRTQITAHVCVDRGLTPDMRVGGSAYDQCLRNLGMQTGISIIARSEHL